MAPRLEDQLAKVFSRGIQNKPELRASLEEALGSLADTKYTKAEAHYGRGEGDERDDKRCGNCSNFESPNRCAIVSGTISATDLCDYFVVDESLTKGGQ